MAQHLKRFVFLLSNRRLKTTKSLKRLKNGGIFSQFFLHQLLTWFRYFLHTIQKKKICLNHKVLFIPSLLILISTNDSLCKKTAENVMM